MNEKLHLNKKQIDIITKLAILLPSDGSASECHEYYCPYNIDCVEDDNRKHISVEGYEGKPDGFDSECPRFLSLNRKAKKWDCLCGLKMIAILLDVNVEDLYTYLEPHFESTNFGICGHIPHWHDRSEEKPK